MILPNADNFAVEEGMGTKAVEWMNSFSKKKKIVSTVSLRDIPFRLFILEILKSYHGREIGLMPEKLS